MEDTSFTSWENTVILTGVGGVAVAEEISGLIGLPYCRAVGHYVAGERDATGESHIQVSTNVRGCDVFVVQSMCHPTNDNLIETALIISACKRASARRVCAIIPYLAYTRQTFKKASRVPISCADVASVLEEACVDSIVTIDLHREQVAGFFSPTVAFETLTYVPVAARFFHNMHLASPVVVAAHASGVSYSMSFFNAMRELYASWGPDEANPTPPPTPSSDGGSLAPPARGADPTFAMLLRAGSNKELELTGDVVGRDAILVDDMIDSGNTTVRSSRELIARGAARVFVFATHGIFSRDARDRVASAPIELVVVTNSVPTVVSGLPAGHKLRRKLAVLSVAPMLAHRICAHSGLPRPEIDPEAPTYAMHAGSSSAIELPASPYGPSPGRLRSIPDSEDFDGSSLWSDPSRRDRGEVTDSESVTTASEFMESLIL